MRETAVVGADVVHTLTSVMQGGQVLPEGTTIPPLAYTGVLVLGLLTVGALLWTLSPPVTHRTVLALAAWMMVGGTLHVIYQLRELPPVIEPLLASPAVYATTAVVAGSVWIVTTLRAAMTSHDPDRAFGVIGLLALSALLTFGVVEAVFAGTLRPLPAVVAVVATGIVAAIAWAALSIYFTDAAAVTSWSGAVVVVSHTLDGVTTAVGHDLLPDATERTPASQYILEVGGMLPTAEYVGAGWLFVFVKLLLAATIVVLFRDWVREQPRPALLAMALIAAVGLGPGFHNLVLFVLGGG